MCSHSTVHPSASAAARSAASCLVEHPSQPVGVDVSHVHGDVCLAGNGSDDAGPALGETDRGHAVVTLADFGDLECESRRGTEAVAAHLHRHGAGVRGLATEDQPLALDALGAGDGADPAAHGLQDRALLDVHLDVGLDVSHPRPRPVEVLDVDAVSGEHVGQLVALLVVNTQYVDGGRADAGRRSRTGCDEPRPLPRRPNRPRPR